MIKIILMTWALTHYMYADFMDSVAEVVKATLSDDEEESIPEIKTVGTLKTTDSSKNKEEKSDILESIVESIQDTIIIEEEVDAPLVGSSTVLSEVADMIDYEEGESFGLPSVFGLNKKKEKKVFGSTILGNVKETGSTFYKGFKTSGESAEFFSGIMYKSSKAYNEMFHMFDGSPFNIFEDKDQNSILDVFEKGNEVLDVFE
jgi:hypothetical protein